MTGTLRNGKVYTARYLQMNDIAMIMQLQEKVKNSLQTKANLQPLTREEFRFILDGNGFMVGIFIEERIVGFRAMLIPEIDHEHLGWDGGLNEQDLRHVIYSEVSCVDPDVRGNGLQTIMGELLFARVDTDRFYYICATVSPNNIPSIKDKLALGMHIIALKEKYDGKLRFIMMKNLLSKGEYVLTDRNNASVNIEDIETQQQLLHDGCYGVNIVETNGMWKVLYRKGNVTES